MKVGFIGLGQMGAGMAGRLLEAGVELRVWNRSSNKAQPLVERGAQQVASALDVAEAGGVVLAMLTDDRALEDATRDLPERLGRGGVLVNLATVSSSEVRRQQQRCAQHGVSFVSAPVFGRPPAAAAGQLVICLSGNAAARQRLAPLLKPMSKAVYEFGDDPASAAVVKLCGNFMIGAAIESMGEAFTLGEKNGVARADMFRLFTETLFDCQVYKGYGAMVSSMNFPTDGVPPAILHKDLGLVLGEARRSLVPMPVAQTVENHLTTMIATGRGEQDFSGLVQVISENSGLRVPSVD